MQIHITLEMCYQWANVWQLLQNEAQQLQSNTKHRTAAALKSNKGSAVRPKIRT